MALAANLRQYFPPRHIQQMEDDLASLSRFWDEGPWGWSLATKQRYRRMGIPESELPSDEWLAEVRRLTSREFGVKYYQEMDNFYRNNYRDYKDNGLVSCQARFCTTFDEVKLYIIHSCPAALCKPANWSDKLYITKAPWSSSGRGNIVVRSPLDEKQEGSRIKRIIREQGGIVVEPFYENKVLDFAMEFWVDGNATRFLGFSVFSTDETGHYRGNYVESQEQLLKRINVPKELLDSLIDYHKRKLSLLSYHGPVGIDMMLLSDGRLHPCVEINFRMTMGLLAILLYEKGITSDQWLTPYRPQGFTAGICEGCLCISTPQIVR